MTQMTETTKKHPTFRGRRPQNGDQKMIKAGGDRKKTCVLGHFFHISIPKLRYLNRNSALNCKKIGVLSPFYLQIGAVGSLAQR